MIILKKDLGMSFPNPSSNQKVRYGIFECIDCGNEYKAPSRKARECGDSICNHCSRSKSKIKHGGFGTRLYRAWQGMKARIHNKNEKCYHYYGGRGLIICDEWYDFAIFRDWAISNGYSDVLTIDRIDNDGNYEPSNCRWVSMSVQQRNKRVLKNTNKSGYKGVCFFKGTKRWVAKICVDYKVIHLGYFDTPKEGAIAYNKYVDNNNLEHSKNIL